MEYTKENIIGVQFIHHTDFSTVYTITGKDDVGTDRYRFTWTTSSGKVDSIAYSFDVFIKYFKDKIWIPIDPNCNSYPIC